MSASGQNHSPFSSRPWFAFAAMTLGIAAMAFGAYTVENRNAFTTRILRATPATPPPAVSKADLPSATDPASIKPLTLDEVKITAKPVRRPVHATVSKVACVENWRSLETGPADRQVREFCPAPK